MTAYLMHFYRRILSKDMDLLNRTKLRILFTFILTFIILTTVLTIIYLLSGQNLLLIRIVCFLSIFIVSLLFFLSNKPWHISSHLFLASVTLLIWTNVFLVHQPLYVINIQYCLLVVAASYYILGSRSGLRYSVVAIFPLLIDIFYNEFLNQRIPSTIVNANYTAYGITLLVNFVLILYIHHLFFKSLTTFKKRELLFKQNLRQAAIEFQEQAMAKTNFLNTMSHQIRTPLNVIVGMSTLLRSGCSPAEQDENLKILDFSAENLMATVNDIIDFNELDNGNIDLKKMPFSIYKTVHSVLPAFREKAAAKQLEFSLSIAEEIKDHLVMGDQLRLSQILIHLIGNAIKFTKEGFVRVSITFHTDQQNVGQFSFKVEDSGIGISQEIKQQLLDPFKKKMRRNQRQYQATLGITIATQLLKLHGSGLEIVSTEGKGSSFSFDITYVIAQTNNIPKTVPLALLDTDLTKLRILAVDDEQLNLMVVKKILANWGIIAEEAVNGKIALEMCLEKEYDVVLMDINMPVMDGFESANAIKNINKPDFTPPRIIALTASVGSSIDQVMLDSAIDDCILKPFKAKELRQKLSQLVARAE